jgi:hypothetical protein
MHTCGEESLPSIRLDESLLPNFIWIGPWSTLLGRRILLPADVNAGIINSFALASRFDVDVGADA